MKKRHDADFLVKDPMVTQKVAGKADRHSDPFDYIDELRQAALDAEGRDYRIWNEVKALKATIHSMDDRLGDTGLNLKIDERLLGNVQTTATKWGAIFLRRAFIAMAIAGGTGFAAGIGWVVKMVLRGMHAQ
jgi:hypothetical protein